MGVNELLFPDQAKEGAPAPAPGEKADCYDDVAFLSLVVMGLIKHLENNHHLSRGDLLRELKGIDGLDGIEDGKIDAEKVRQMLGYPKK